jgi:hypothetical protein
MQDTGREIDRNSNSNNESHGIEKQILNELGLPTECSGE